ncbi:MAG TPA: hypothetical protein VJB97_01075 [Candidatus Paceibacterota bacterium]
MHTRILVVGIAIIILGVIAYYIASTRSDAPTGDTMALTVDDQNDSMDKYRDPMMTGKWQSKEDAKFTREFKADGSIVDTYEGDASATMTGTWVVVDPEAEMIEGVPLDTLAGMTVIRIDFEEPLYFSLNSLSETELTMTYLGRGNILMFTKVQ